jgi:predicted DNA-binding ribbon-helix-helix protein
MEKHSITIAGHATSLSLEPIFWQALNEAARDLDKPVAALVAEIDAARTRRRMPENLSSALRVWLFERARNAQGTNPWPSSSPTS